MAVVASRSWRDALDAVALAWGKTRGEVGIYIGGTRGSGRARTLGQQRKSQSNMVAGRVRLGEEAARKGRGGGPERVLFFSISFPFLNSFEI